MSKILLAVTGLLSVTLLCEGAPAKKVPAKKAKPLTAAEIYVRTGGMVSDPGVGTGYVAVVNMQTKVPAAELVAPLVSIDRLAPYAVRVVADPEAARDAGLQIRVIDDATKPTLVAAPEASWAEVNVATLVSDIKSESGRKKFLVGRTRKEMLRALAFAAGSGGSGFPDNLLDVVQARDLDYVKEFLPFDTRDGVMRHLAKRGVKPNRLATYLTACEEGWAPQPTNDVQQAIWDKVYAIPKNPMKIEFDPKKGR